MFATHSVVNLNFLFLLTDMVVLITDTYNINLQQLRKLVLSLLELQVVLAKEIAP